MAKMKKTAVMQGTPVRESEAPTNKYYLLVSERYMRAKYFTLIVLAVYLAVMLVLFREDITYANLMYLLRDFNTGEASYSAGFDPIDYDEQDNMSYAMFRDELAVIGNRTLRMYNSKGEESRSYEPGYSDPVLVSSEKYLLAYDIGNTSYSVFTSIARVNNGEAEGEIEKADVNDNGEYLLVCRSDETKYVVCTYDSSFRPIANYYKNKYVTSSAIGEDGQVLIVSFDSEGGGFKCEVELYLEGKEEAESTYTVSGVFPVECGIWDDGGYYVICTDRVLFFGDNGELLNSSLSATGYTSFAVSDETIALSFETDILGGNSGIFVFDTSGELLYNNTVNGNVSSLALTGDAVYALAGGSAYMMPIEGGEILSVDTADGGAVLLQSGTSAVVCRRDGAEGLIFGDDESGDETVSGS